MIKCVTWWIHEPLPSDSTFFFEEPSTRVCQACINREAAVTIHEKKEKKQQQPHEGGNNKTTAARKPTNLKSSG
jgi:hypothetical protein